MMSKTAAVTTGLTIREAMARVWQNRWRLIAYEAFVAAVGVFLIAPSVSWLINRFAAASGRIALTNEQIVDFALSFWGLASVIVIGVVLLVGSMIGRIGIVTIGVMSEAGRTFTAVDAAMFAMGSLGDLASLSLRLILRYLVVAVPALGIVGVIYIVFLSEGDINFYLAMRPPAFWWAVGLATPVVLVGGLILIVMYTRWMFALPICLLEHVSPRDAFAASASRIRPMFRSVAVVHVAWLVGFGVVNFMLAFGLRWLAPIPLEVISGSVSMLLIGGVLIVLISIGMTTAMAFIGFSVFHMITVGCYLQGGGDKPIAALERANLQNGRMGWIGRPSTRVVAVVIIGLGVMVGLGVGRAMFNQIQLKDDVQITAHRAAAAYAPENTLAALAIAIEQKADWAEIDVQETSDGEIIVLHDKDLRRLAGDPRAIYNLTYDQLQDIDIGSWFDPKFADQRIATLEQFIEASKGKIKLNIELKDNGHAVALPKRVAEIIRRHDFVDQCIVTSLNYDMLIETRRHLPGVELGMVIGMGVGNFTAYDVDAFSMNIDQLSSELVYQFHATDREVLAWTLNTRKQLMHALDIGVDNLITDYPDLAHDVLRERAEMSTSARLLLAIRSRLAQ